MKAAQAFAQWLVGVKSGQSSLAEAERKLDEHNANPPKSADAAEHRAWLATGRNLDDDVQAEKRALLIAEERAAEAEAAAAKDEADVEEQRVRKLNGELAKLTVEIGGGAKRLAAQVTQHTSMLAEIEAWNASRGSRPLIVDGEQEVRAIPDRVIPAVFEERDAWYNGGGRSPMVFRVLASGERVPAENGYTKTREKVCVQRENVVPGGLIGGRFKDTFRIPGLKGETLFPAR